MSLDVLFILAIGTAIMLIPVLVMTKLYGISIWKAPLIAIILTVFGTIGTYLLFYVENGRFGGTSFFGALFFVPLPFLLMSKVFRIPYGQLLDICGPSECIMLVFMKVQCIRNNCCKGIVLCENELGNAVRFPSQIVELIAALIIAIILIILASRKKNTGKIYAFYMIIYGGSRFVFNFLRETSPVFLAMGNGSIWGLASVIIGVSVLICMSRLRSKFEQ